MSMLLHFSSVPFPSSKTFHSVGRKLSKNCIIWFIGESHEFYMKLYTHRADIRHHYMIDVVYSSSFSFNVKCILFDLNMFYLAYYGFCSVVCVFFSWNPTLRIFQAFHFQIFHLVMTAPDSLSALHTN